MSSMEKIFERGKSYLTVTGHKPLTGGDGQTDGDLVWSHSVRVWELTQRICAEHQVDISSMRTPLAAASLFHDAGWIAMLHDGHIGPAEVFARPADMNLRQLSEKKFRSVIGDLLSRSDLEQACAILKELAKVKPETAAGKAVADADNLEEIGMVGILHQVRSAILSGRSPGHMLQVWRRQQEYHYWEARIKTGFNFDFSRRLAHRRLERMAEFFNTFERELKLDDLDDGDGAVDRVPTRTEENQESLNG